jgi:probable O-glycosylation ligase (exosortase A-associated)
VRDLVVALVVFGWVPFALFKPQIGVLLWSWISHMNPHQQGYGFALTFPFLDGVAAATAAGVMIDKGRQPLPGHPIVAAMIIYLLWTFVTTIAAFEPSEALTIEKLVHFVKVLVFIFVSMIVMQSPNRLKAFVWMIALSMAYVSVKGGLFTLATGGSGRVTGAGGMMEDNNQLAMAMAMTLPLGLYLFQHPPVKILKWPALGFALTTALSVVGTQSRGGFVALAAVLFMLLMKTKRKFTVLALMIPLALGGLYFAPDSWKNRIASTEESTDDASFRGRVVMWKFSSNLADENPIEGGGFNVFYMRRAQELYMPPGETPRAPHSIYFEVLGEHGYVGLVLFLTMIFTGWYSGGTTARRLRPYKETRWLGDLCAACQLSLVGYAAGGLTVNIATFDYFYDLLAIIVLATVVGDKLIARGVTDVAVPDGEEGAKAGPSKPKKWSPPKPATKAARSGATTP